MSIDQTTLSASPRTAHGRRNTADLRTTGVIPAVIYGKNTQPMSVSIDPIALAKALATPHRMNTVITVKIEGAGEKLVLLKDHQRHPVSRKLLHADFQEVQLDQEVIVEVPVTLTGKAIGTADGGLLSQVSRTLRLKALPRAIPETINVDVTALKIGSSLHASEIKFPAGVKLADQRDPTIAVVSVPDADVPVAAAAAAAAPDAKVAGAAAGKADAKGAAAAGKTDAKAAAGKAAPAAKGAPAKK